MKKIYIIDDDIDFLQLMDELLGKKYDITTATRLDVTGIYKFSPDLILLDNFLGNTHGDRLLWELSLQMPNFDVPVIIMSGHELNPTKYPDVVKAFIPKPCSIKIINKTLQDFFDGTLEPRANMLA